MVATAYVLISVKAGMARRVYESLTRLGNVQHVDVVSGPHDMIATVQGPDFAAIGRLVMDKLGQTEGITDTITCHVIPVEQ